jgi:mono/diheme cytochrome c family protein
MRPWAPADTNLTERPETMRLANRSITAAVAAALFLLPSAVLAAGDAAAGKATFSANCASCHGETGKGDGPVGAALQPPPRDFSQGEFKFDGNGNGKPGEDEDLKAVITQGAAAFGGSPLMAPWPTLSDADVANVIAYVRSLKQ